MELSSMIKKIGHSLLEIRVRALKNILCKLDHSLINVNDIVQEKMLFVYLLEWFNFPEVPMKEEVLELLLTLSKHPSAAQMLRDVGAVDFLTLLSPNLEPRLRTVIDGTLDQLFQLPELLPSHSAVYSHGAHCTTPTVASADENSLKTGYFHKDEPSNIEVPPKKIAVNESVRCLKFSVFPWLALTNTDGHILSSNESSLGSTNPNLVRTTCELLCDVIMQDFPAEIFLQRPGIVKNLLSLLRLGSCKGEVNHLHSPALSCLRQLCVGLRRRLRFHQDPGFCSAKQDAVSQNSSLSYTQEVQGNQRSHASSPATERSPRPSVLGRTGQRARGDGQDGDAASDSGSSQRGAGVAVQAPGQISNSPEHVAQLELPDLGAEDTLELQLQQLTLAQFTVATLQHAIPLLKTEGLHMFHRVLELLCDAVLLLGDSVCELVWDDHSLVGMELKESLQTCMELLSDILSYHQNSSADTPQINHRLAYLGTAVFTIKFLQTVLPPEKASSNLQDNMAAAIFHLSLDTSFGSFLPSMQEAAVAYLEQVNADDHDVYRRVTRAALWMESTCSFIKETQAEGEKNWLELLELADQATDGLPFHLHLPIIKHCVLMCSYLWRFDQPSPFLQTESQKLLLKMLSHPLLAVKMEAYECTLNLVKDCLGIQNVSRQEPAACTAVNFLLHHRVLYEISTFGLQDSAEKVSLAAKDILLFLLKGRLMMTATAWVRFNEALHPVIPILQGYANTEESLGNCVLLISDTSDPGALSNTAKLKAALRLLFSKKPTVRMAAVQQILPHITSSEDASTSRPDVDQSVIASLPNIFCGKNLVDVTLDTSSKSLLKVESVEKLFCLLSSDSVDISLKRSAAEQLSVVLQDTTMHPVLKSLGITDKVISFMMESVQGNKSLDCLLEPCACILRKLVYADPSLRHSLAQRNLLLLSLLRASLILKENKGNGSEIAVLMTLLLFDEVASSEIWLENTNTDVKISPFSLPLSAARSYNLPFQAATHHAVSPYRCLLAPSDDLLALNPARQALQVAWNTAWHSGINNLLEKQHGGTSNANEFNPDLKLSESQLLSVRVAHLPSALQDCIQAIATAAGHRPVASSLSGLSLYLLIDRLVLPHVPTYNCRDTLQSLSWHVALSRFLLVRPACVEDERLLVGIVTFLNAYFKRVHAEFVPDAEDRDLRWILELLLNQIKGSGPHTPNISSALSIADEPPASRLTAQGQSDTDTSNSVTSQESQPSAVETTLIVTPDLLTAHCGVLTNLLAILPDFTLTAIRQNQLLHLLANLVDVGLIEKCLTELKMPNVLPGEREEVKSQLVTALQFLSGFSKLLQSSVLADKELIGQMDFMKRLLSTLVAVLMLDIKELDTDIRLVVCACWDDVFTLLAALLRRNSSATHPSVSAALAKRWRSFAGTLSECMSKKLADHHLHTVALQFLATVFTEETKCRTEAITNSERSSPLLDILNGPPANQLCELLLQSFEGRSLQDPLKKLTGRALMTLLTCSPTAQNFASKAGLIDSCVEQLRQTHSQLQLESVRPGKVSLHKKEALYLKEVKLTVEILRSALYCNDESKTAATDARLSPAMHALWPWLLLDDPTMEAALEALCVYTANCTTACSALCGSSPGVAAGVKGSSSSSNSSLMHSVMKLTSLASSGPIQSLAFFLLANLAASRDCRGILQKNNFLQAFLSVPVPKAPGLKATPADGSGSLLGLWLRLLVILSSAEDGQQSILKVTGSLEMLADLATHRRHALLTLHNLCFHPANKSHVLTNEKAVNVLLSCLDNKDMEARCIGASALWALLHNNQRAKTSLKCPTVRLKIEEAHAVSKKDAETKPEALSFHLLKCLENLSHLLKN
ncbi:Rotatin [Oryzias melastigma]|uniref:Rotatin n=1 Tax=Oryzias melastigma TaxID=30732 RepID=A0A834C846_ORYME|nr:Rotatin [Oryzias melastigma]